MNREFIVRPLARLDVLEAIEWYSERSREIGAEFVRVLDAAFESIRQNPAQFPEVDGPIRKAVLRPFPYTVLFTADETEIVVLSVFHVRRDPKHWKGRK
jgi:toxin ParE1/3/4